ncbi:MAG: DUF2817 domain-containing protein [Gammaproteobacteria bacterium]|nr:MAG: DUF2817 domain-containing protein [Gammaproteobacteria bacterium]
MPTTAVLQCFAPWIFPRDYHDGCRRWAEAVSRLSLPSRCRDYSVERESSLVCQTAWLGPEDATRVVILIGGTHGVEGYTGTAVQVDVFQLMDSGQWLLPEDTALLCINALNPWGYANNRRCDGQGIDVNRNFVDFFQPLPSNPGYLHLRPLLGIADRAARSRALQAFAAREGGREYEIAFSGGQYVDAAGPFYGGMEPSFSRCVIDSLIADNGLAERQLAVIDIHTGLGPYGYGEIICDHPPGSTSEAAAKSWYGPGCGVPASGTSCSVPKHGLLDYAWHDVMTGGSCFVTLEFGTLGTDALFEVLLDEAAAWAQGAPPETLRQEVSRAMRSHFYPDDPAWREAVIFRARQVIQQALWGLTGRGMVA